MLSVIAETKINEAKCYLPESFCFSLSLPTQHHWMACYSHRICLNPGSNNLRFIRYKLVHSPGIIWTHPKSIQGTHWVTEEEYEWKGGVIINLLLTFNTVSVLWTIYMLQCASFYLSPSLPWKIYPFCAWLDPDRAINHTALPPLAIGVGTWRLRLFNGVP